MLYKFIYRLFCFLEWFGHAPSLKVTSQKQNHFELSKSFIRDSNTMSYKQRLRYFLCYLNIHSPYPSYCYPSCWVCGQNLFEEEHIKWKKQFVKTV